MARSRFVIGQTYFQRSNQDLWRFEAPGVWVRKGNIRDEGSSGLVGVSPVLGMGYSMAALVSRIRYLTPDPMALGFILSDLIVDRIRQIVPGAMSMGFNALSAVARSRFVATAFAMGISEQASVTATPGNVRLLAAAFNIGQNQAASILRTRFLATAFNFGAELDADLTVYHLRLIAADMALGFSLAATMTRVTSLTANFALGYTETTALSRIRNLSAAYGFGAALAAAVTHASVSSETLTGMFYNYNATTTANFFDVGVGATQSTLRDDPTPSFRWAYDTTIADLSYDGKYMAVVDLAVNAIKVYDISANPVTLAAQLTPTNIAGQKNVCEFSKDGKFLFVGGSNSPRNALTAFMYSTADWSLLTLPSLPGGTGNEVTCATFNKEGTRFFLCDYNVSAPVIYGWSISGTTFTYLGVVFAFTGTNAPTSKMAVSPDGTRLVVCRAAVGATLIALSSSGTTLTLTTNNLGGISATGYWAAFNPTSDHIAIAFSASPWFATVNLSTPTATESAFSNPPASTTWAVEYSVDGLEVLACTNSAGNGELWAYGVSSRARTIRTMSGGPTAKYHLAIQRKRLT